MLRKKFGIDLSHHNEGINFDTLKNEGVEFAILRAGYTGYGNGVSKAKDNQFENFYNQCKQRGIGVGAYWFSCANTYQKGVDEANWMYENCLKGNTSQANTILPSEYTQVDYIQSSGTQYIDTGVKLSPDYGFDIKFLTNNVFAVTTGYGCIFGGRNSSGDRDYQLTTFGASPYVGTLRWGYASGAGTASADITLNTVQQCSLINKTFTSCNGTVTQLISNTEQSNYNCFLFGLNNGTSGFSQSGNGCRIYYCKFYDGNNLIRDYVPCYRNSDNEIGMYDLVNNVFYTNSGTGAFTYGAVATLPNPDYPQDIHVVSGDNMINICGRNLAYTGWAEDFVARINNANKAEIVNYNNKNCLHYEMRAGYPDYTTGYMFKINWKENTQYTFSLDIINPTRSFTNMAIVYTDGTSTNFGMDLVANTWTHKVVTSTANKTIDYVRADYQDGWCYIDLDTFMVYEGTETLPYEPYQSHSYPITLPEGMFLGWIPNTTYRDRIFQAKTGDTYYDSLDSTTKESLTYGKWYLNKKIGKVVLNGSESWNTTAGGTNTNRFSLSMPTLMSSTNGYCNNNKYVVSGVSTDQELVGISSSTLYFRINKTTASELSVFKTWLGNNNSIIYAPLVTPTYTEITDSTLLSQLNALAKSYNSQTNISQESNDLASILNATALSE